MVPSKREKCLGSLKRLRGDSSKLASFLMNRSGLPGRRADIELAAALADMFEIEGPTKSEKQMLGEWLKLSPDEAPVNTKREFLPFCAAQATGVLYLQAGASHRQKLFRRIAAASRDPRWRTREAACFAFQRIATRDFDEIERVFSSWILRSCLMEKRAMVVSLAHPPVLVEGARVEFCCKIADQALSACSAASLPQRKTEGYRVLKKGLEFVLSVYAAKEPDIGFAFLDRWASSENVEIKKIVAANLGKSRLARKHPERCREIEERLAAEA